MVSGEMGTGDSAATGDQSVPPTSSWRKKFLAWQERDHAKAERALDRLDNKLAPSRREYIWSGRGRWVVISVVFIGITALAKLVVTKTFGPAVLAGVGGALFYLLLAIIKKYRTDVSPYTNEDEARREQQMTEREKFLPTAVVSKCNPSGKTPDNYPELYRAMFADMATIASDVDAVIRVVRYSDKSITIDTGPFYAGSVKKELIARAARDKKQLILHTREHPDSPK
jgi:hypothetical protein